MRKTLVVLAAMVVAFVLTLVVAPFILPEGNPIRGPLTALLLLLAAGMIAYGLRPARRADDRTRSPTRR